MLYTQQKPFRDNSLLRSNFTCVVILLLLLISDGVPASDLTESLRFKRLLQGDNGSSEVINTVNVTRQDPNGFIWLGGEVGLARYDGHDIRIYQHDPNDPSSLTSNVIWDMVFDREGVMWLATDSGLGRYNPGSDDFTSYHAGGYNTNTFPSNSVRALKVDTDNNLLIATDSGFSILDSSREKYRSFTNNENDPNRLPGIMIRAVLVEDNGDIWLGTVEEGLLRLRLEPFDVEVFTHHPNEPDSLINNRITSIIRDHTGALWVSTFGGGVSRMNQDGNSFTNYSHSPHDLTSIGSNTVWAVFEDRDNNLWVATDHGGLGRYNRDEDNFSHLRHNPSNSASLSSDHVRSIFEDRDGDLWVGTFPIGMNFLDRSGSLFKNYAYSPQQENSLSHSTILTIEKSKQGHLWVGTEGGINMFDPDTKSNRRLVANPGVEGALQSNAVLSMAEQDNGDLWVGTWSGGLHLMDYQSGEFKQFMPSDKDSDTVNSAYIWSLLIDKKQQVWIGTETAGLNRYNIATQRFEHFEASVPPTPQTVSNVLVWSLIEDHADTIWAGTAHGLNRYDPQTQKFSHYFNEPDNDQSICSNRVVVVFEDSKFNIWIGTQGGGISILDPWRENFLHISTENGLPSDNVASIIEDQSGGIWAATDKGIALLSLDKGVIKTYKKAHGLIGNNFNRDAAYLHNNGELYLGSTDGLSVFNPKDVQDGVAIPKVTLTDFRVFNESVTPKTPDSSLKGGIANADEITLKYNQSFFSTTFSTLNYRAASLNQYAYRLVGFDKGWNYVGNHNIANYTNIGPGNYTLQVKAASNNGEWREGVTTLRIHILPPIWRTYWAYAGYIVVMLYFFWALVKFKAKRIELEKEREVVNKLVAIDKMKDSFLANTSHELRTPLNGIIGLAESLRESTAESLNTEQAHHLEMIVASGRRLSHLINDILDMSKLAERSITLKKDEIDLHYQIDLVISLLTPLTKSKSIELINNVPNNLGKVVADQNRLQQILLNLIGNGIKYSDRGYVKISAERSSRDTTVRVEDTGIGIKTEHVNEIFQSFYQVENSDIREHGGTGLGLTITKQLVELHGGELSVESVLGQGTIVTFTIPKFQGSNKPERKTSLQPKQAPEHKGQAIKGSLENINEKLSPSHKSKSPNEMAVLAPANAASITILVVDDDPVNRMVLNGILKLHQYKIIEADDGESAIRCVQQNPAIDLVVLDVMMPRMTGYEACKKIRETYPMHLLPIIFLTAKNIETELTQGFACGGNDFVNKPVNKEEFLARIKAQLLTAKKVNEDCSDSD